MNSYLQLPEISKRFCEAGISDVTYGPRQEFTLACHELIWEGLNGHYSEAITYIRFGGVTNLDAVREFFATRPHDRSELGAIVYAKDHVSKTGRIFVEIFFERIDAKLSVQCRNISIS
jgi:hypothetical protein